MTVEGLHSAFQKIDDRMKAMIEKGKTDSMLSACIRKAWEEYFHRDLSAAAVKGMIHHYRAVHKSKRSKGTRKQKGGMAPLDYTMGQGSTAAVYGRFPVEYGATPSVVNSLDNDRFFESSVGRICNSTGGFDAPSQIGGRRRTRSKKSKMQRGGDVFDDFLQPYAPASVPRNFVETGLSSIQGRPIMNPASSPVSYHPILQTHQPPPFNPVGFSQITGLAPVYQA